MNWQGPVPAAGTTCLAQIRARHRAVPAVVEPLSGNRAIVRFAAPVSAITPGQVVALYDGELLLGGGWIERAVELPPMDYPPADVPCGNTSS
jgi:tRNA-specific 2-thiouridylase